jgi:peptide methionine sulfoxide reductase MsrB
MPNYYKDAEAFSRLSPEQFEVTQRNGTKRPFRNARKDNKEPGLYVDVVSGEPLFYFDGTSSTAAVAGRVSLSRSTPKTSLRVVIPATV